MYYANASISNGLTPNVFEKRRSRPGSEWGFGAVVGGFGATVGGFGVTIGFDVLLGGAIGLADEDAELAGGLLLVLPAELRSGLGVELVVQWFGIVVVDEDEPLAAREIGVGLEDRLVTLCRRSIADVELLGHGQIEVGLVGAARVGIGCPSVGCVAVIVLGVVTTAGGSVARGCLGVGIAPCGGLGVGISLGDLHGALSGLLIDDFPPEVLVVALAELALERPRDVRCDQLHRAALREHAVAVVDGGVALPFWDLPDVEARDDVVVARRRVAGFGDLDDPLAAALLAVLPADDVTAGGVELVVEWLRVVVVDEAEPLLDGQFVEGGRQRAVALLGREVARVERRLLTVGDGAVVRDRELPDVGSGRFVRPVEFDVRLDLVGEERRLHVLGGDDLDGVAAVGLRQRLPDPIPDGVLGRFHQVERQ